MNICMLGILDQCDDGNCVTCIFNAMQYDTTTLEKISKKIEIYTREVEDAFEKNGRDMWE